MQHQGVGFRAAAAPSARAMTEAIAPPNAPAEMVCISITAGTPVPCRQRVGAELTHEESLDEAALA